MFQAFRRVALALLVAGSFLQFTPLKASSGQESEASSPSMEINGGKHVNAGDSYLLTVQGMNGPSEIIFCDAKGMIVRKTSLNLEKGANFIRLSLGELPAGLYFLKLHSGEQKTETALILR